MAKAIQCPSCGRKYRVTTLPDAPTFSCEGCGQNLKVPAQFRPSVMASSRHIVPPQPASQPASTSVFPEAAAAPAAPAAPAAARRPVRARPRPGSKPDAGPRPVPLLLRLLAWGAALVLGLVVTVWLARISGWLSGDRFVDVFTGTGGMERYLRILALAPVWALFATGLLTLFLDGGRALARRRAAVRAERGRASGRRFGRAPTPAEASDDELGEAGAGGDGQRSRRKAARRGAS
jgi:hypothetical protein